MNGKMTPCPGLEEDTPLLGFIGEKERKYLDSMYELHEIGESVSERTDFLKGYMGYQHTSSKTPEAHLEALEIAVITEEVGL